MLLPLLLAAALAQEEPPEIFALNDGWQIARAGSGCLMIQEFGGEGNTILTLSIDPELADAPLRLIVGNGLWELPEADDEGYALDFSGNGATWQDLAAQTFPSENEDGSVDGVISVAFSQEQMTPMLVDMAGADGLRLSRRDTIVSEFRFSGAEEGIRSLGQCLATLP